MARRDDPTSLSQMLLHARKAVRLAAPLSEGDFMENEIYSFALWKLVEIVGEAASRVSEAERAALPDLPWRAIIGMRNHLAHGYDLIDLPTLQATVGDDLPPLIAALEAVLPPEESEPSP